MFVVIVYCAFSTFQDLTKRQKEEESLRQGLEDELDRIIEETNEGMDSMDNEAVV